MAKRQLRLIPRDIYILNFRLISVPWAFDDFVPVRVDFVLDPVNVAVDVVVVLEAEVVRDGRELGEGHEAEQGAISLGNLGMKLCR